MAVLGQSQYVIGPMTLSRTESFGSGYYNYLDQSNNNSSSNYYYTNLNGNSTMIEKRQVFLRSYQFCRKKSLSERIKRSLMWLFLQEKKICSSLKQQQQQPHQVQ
ncbi:hypothetical protein F8388_009788 [Cannabis sativa]|uniref:Uncharacterized protein n=1 Tax=Cannabis sativa TaxID=3483 RepID=A0A7J6H3F3_CANSA|nr:hypothetical protein G4B88_020619 [Cannabis sativa]KAF4389655.1 hypothetical protein F8388_009788 [Cannabis sativa]